MPRRSVRWLGVSFVLMLASAPASRAAPNPPPPPGNRSEHRMFEQADYTYHQGVFDVHFNDTVTANETMYENGIFQSVELEQRFWDVLSGWEEASTKLHGVPVLGVGRGRVFHSLSVKSMRHKWRENLTEEDLDVYKSIGVRTARLGFQWVEPEVNWEQLGLQYLYMEYLQETQRLNSGMAPMLNASDPTSVNPEYMQPIGFDVFVQDEKYSAAHDPAMAAPRSRPAAGIFPTVNYSKFAPELNASLQLKLGRGTYFKRVVLPTQAPTSPTAAPTKAPNSTNSTAPEPEPEPKKDDDDDDDDGETQSSSAANSTNTTAPEPEPELDRAAEAAAQARKDMCTCAGALPPSATCRGAVGLTCAHHPTQPFCRPCVGKLVDNYDAQGECLLALRGYTSQTCPAAWGAAKPVGGLMQSLPRPEWMESWKISWYQQRQQWWDAQRKQYRPQVWSMVERLTRQGLYTQLDFRPKFSAGTSYCGPGVKLPPSADPIKDMWLCFVPDRTWKRP